jgi:hypothetical protein
MLVFRRLEKPSISRDRCCENRFGKSDVTPM